MIRLQPTYHFHPREDLSGMGSRFQFIGKVLTGPVFIMLPISPKPAVGHVINKPTVSDPCFRAVLPVSEGQLGKTEFTQFHHSKASRASLHDNLQKAAF